MRKIVFGIGTLALFALGFSWPDIMSAYERYQDKKFALTRFQTDPYASRTQESVSSIYADRTFLLSSGLGGLRFLRYYAPEGQAFSVSRSSEPPGAWYVTKCIPKNERDYLCLNYDRFQFCITTSDPNNPYCLPSSQAYHHDTAAILRGDPFGLADPRATLTIPNDDTGKPSWTLEALAKANNIPISNLIYIKE